MILIILILLFLPLATPLTCMACVHTAGTTQLDNFRVTTRLSKAYCLMEPIRCDRDQDVCVTITMHIGGGEYWLGTGCDRRTNFHHMSCQNVPTVSRNVQLGYVQERRAMQRVCVCGRDMCNSSFTNSIPIITILLLIIFTTIGSKIL